MKFKYEDINLGLLLSTDSLSLSVKFVFMIARWQPLIGRSTEQEDGNSDAISSPSRLNTQDTNNVQT